MAAAEKQHICCAIHKKICRCTYKFLSLNLKRLVIRYQVLSAFCSLHA
jgi:hypothetical protein